MTDLKPFDENEWNRFKEERLAYIQAGTTDSGLPKPSIKSMDLTGKFSKGEDWSYSNFEDCLLAGADLESANLQHCYLRGADLSGANLKSADLTRSTLIQATLTGADLSQASLANTNMEGADANECNFSGADFEGAFLISVDFSDSIFKDADLGGVRAAGSNFTQAELLGATLSSAHMEGTDFTDANLARSNSSGVNFTNSELTQTNFFEADLIKADLTGSVTLGMRLDGANLTNAKLPDEVAAFSGLKIIEESSKLLRTLFLMMISVVAFSLLTIASTTDVQLLTNSTSFPLPIIGTPVSIQQFYLIAPFGIACLYFYFHLYLIRHYRLISKLPAVFPDGTPFDERLYPWMFNTWTKIFFTKLQSQDRLADALTHFLIIFLGWMLVPTLLLVFMGRFVVTHSWTITEVHFFLTLFTLGAAFYLLVTLEKKVFAVSLGIKNKILRYLWVVFVLAGSLHLYLLFGKFDSLNSDLDVWLTRANFIGKDVSFRPDNWDPLNPLAGVKGANLKEASLRGAYGYNVFLVKAKMENANLSGARFEEADLRGADLQKAQLVNGFFHESLFDKATLVGANLNFIGCARCSFKSANLDSSDLSGSFLAKANLQAATLQSASLLDANLTEASLVGADLRNTNMLDVRLHDANIKYVYFVNAAGLTPQQVKQARHWKWALFDNSLRKKLGISDVDLMKRLPEIVKGHHPGFSSEEVKIKVDEWKKFYAINVSLN